MPNSADGDGPGEDVIVEESFESNGFETNR